jgi:GcrA cell cycle regulator
VLVVTFTEEHEVQLVNFYNAGLTDMQIVAQMPGTTQDVIQTRRSWLGLHKRQNWGAKSWTNDDEQNLCEWWAAGISATAISAKLDGRFTRNAVLGKVHRMNLPARKVLVTGIRAPRAPRQIEYKKRIRVARYIAPMPFKPVVVALPEPSADLRCSIVEVTGCRFAYGDGPFEFCNHEKHGSSSYCEYHTKLCWRGK